ncbi:hypothetical protein MRX96_031813 [Rhipicephalus microplus]
MGNFDGRPDPYAIQVKVQAAGQQSPTCNPKVKALVIAATATNGDTEESTHTHTSRVKSHNASGVRRELASTSAQLVPRAGTDPLTEDDAAKERGGEGSPPPQDREKARLSASQEEGEKGCAHDHEKTLARKEEAEGSCAHTTLLTLDFSPLCPLNCERSCDPSPKAPTEATLSRPCAGHVQRVEPHGVRSRQYTVQRGHNDGNTALCIVVDAEQRASKEKPR